MALSAVHLSKLLVPDAAVFIVPDDVLSCIADFVDDAPLGAFISACKSLRWSLLNMDDMWLSRLVALMGLYTGIAYLERGESESAFHYYARCRSALESVESMARRHMKNQMPYMFVHGTFQDQQFVPLTPLRLPASTPLC